MPKKTQSQAKTNWLIKTYSKKGYSTNKIQKLLKARHLGIRRTILLEKVRRYKGISKRQRKQPAQAKPKQPAKEKKNLKFLYDVRFRIAYVSREAGHNRYGAISAKILSTTDISTERIYYMLLNRCQSLDKWVSYVSPNHHDVIYSQCTMVNTNRTDGIYNLKFEDLRTW